MAAVRPVVEEFAARMLADLPRRDQRAKVSCTCAG
jgi:hypothetical protein